MLLANTPTQAKSQKHSLEQVTENMCFNQKGDISRLNGGSLKLVNKFTYPRSSVISTENDINGWLVKAWTTIVRLSIIWKSDLSDKIKCNFFQASVNSIIWMQYTDAKLIEKKLHGNCARMLWGILNKSSKQHPTKQQVYRQDMQDAGEVRMNS